MLLFIHMPSSIRSHSIPRPPRLSQKLDISLSIRILRPEGPPINRPGARPGLDGCLHVSAEGAARCKHCKQSLFHLLTLGRVSHLRRSFLFHLPIPTSRSGLFTAGPSALFQRVLRLLRRTGLETLLHHERRLAAGARAVISFVQPTT